MTHLLSEIPGIEEHLRAGVHSYGAYGPTYDVKTPSFDTTLWRYMDFAKFVSLLENQALFFARSDKLDDPFEGSWSDVNLRKLQVEAERGTDLAFEIQAWRLVVSNTRHERRYTLINSWHASEHESEAMWKLYSRYGYGLAIRTDFKTLVHSFTNQAPDIIANVEYISYESDQMPWSMEAPYLHKRLSFAHEREVRAIFKHFIYKQTDRPDADTRDYSRDVCEVGIPYAVDPTDLIHEIMVSPHAESWLPELVQSVCKRYGIDKTVRTSGMLKPPGW